jgi:AAA domain
VDQQMHDPTPAEEAWEAREAEYQEWLEKYDDLMNKVAAGRLANDHYSQTLDLGRSFGDVARVMREGPKPPPMLVPEWLVAGELHWMYAEPGGAKTWFALWLAKQVIEGGDVVLWIDEELGVDTMAARLLALGADPDTVERLFAYLPYPGWFSQADDTERWVRAVKLAQPGLLVVDTATDALAEANLDEDKGIAVTTWIKAFCEPARQLGAAVLVLDHVPKSGSSGGYAVGSRAKKAKAKVQFELSTKREFDAYTVGAVKVTRTKNGLGADIPKKRNYRVGGEVDDEGNETFILEQDSGVGDVFALNGDKALRDKILAAIKEHGPLTTGQVKQVVSGNSAKISKLLAEAADSDLDPITATKQGRSIVYSYTPQADGDTPVE